MRPPEAPVPPHIAPSVQLAHTLADQLRNEAGVVAVVLGGSWARSTARPDSDVDVGILYEPDSPPNLASLNRLARDLDDRGLPDLLTPLGGWGPWINGGGWLRVQGTSVDWLYRDLRRVRHTITECQAGRPAVDYQPGHPHGFHSHIYLAEVYLCRPLADPHGVVAELKGQVATYPPLLKQALVQRFLWESGFALDTAAKPAARGEVQYVVGCLYRAVACLVQVLYALNERYFINEKGSVQEAGTFTHTPTNFEQVVSEILSTPGAGPEELLAALSKLRQIRLTIEDLTAGE